MKLKGQMEGANAESSLTLNLGEWYWIYASYIYTVGGVGVSAVYINGGQFLAPYTSNAQGASKLSNTDLVRFGAGFSGKLRRMQVYSPAALKLNESPFFSLFPSL